MANGQPQVVYAAPPRRGDNTKLILGLAAVAGGGFLAYKYWWVPKKFQEQLALEAAMQKQMHPGLTDEQAMSNAIGALCQAGAAAKFGMPPGATAGMCNALAPGALALLKHSPKIITTAMGLVSHGVTTTVGIAKTVAGGAIDIATMPYRAAWSGAKSVVSTGAGVVSDVWGGTKSVVSDVGGAVTDVGKGAVNVAGDAIDAVGSGLKKLKFW